MLRRANKIDVNQNEIVSGLRKLGFSVLIISSLKNCCDIIVGKDGLNWLVEIKADKKKKLTEGEQKFHDSWKGKIYIVTNIEDTYEMLLNDLKIAK
jgi:Holliday junction resolvase